MNRPAGAGGTFLDTPHGRTFCICYPGGERAVLAVSPFAEEMNRTRRMWTELAAALAAQGIAVLIPDLHGTGESDGDFSDARWERWLDDLAAARREAAARGATRIALVGARLGALLALDFARRVAASEDPGLERVVLWQPVLSGQQFMNQFLRLKLAAGIRRAGGPAETTGTLRARLARGERLEVAGYELPQALVASIDALSLAQLIDGALPPISWLELSSSDPPAVSPASARELAALASTGRTIESRVVTGEPFWALQETTIAPQLVAATASVLDASP